MGIGPCVSPHTNLWVERSHFYQTCRSRKRLLTNQNRVFDSAVGDSDYVRPRNDYGITFLNDTALCCLAFGSKVDQRRPCMGNEWEWTYARMLFRRLEEDRDVRERFRVREWWDRETRDVFSNRNSIKIRPRSPVERREGVRTGRRTCPSDEGILMNTRCGRIRAGLGI